MPKAVEISVGPREIMSTPSRAAISSISSKTALVLSHDDQEYLFIGGAHVLGPWHASVPRCACASRSTAFTIRRVANGSDCALCSFNTLDVRHLDPLSTGVEDAQDGLGVVLGDANNGRNPAQVRDPDHLPNGSHVEGGVFHVDKSAVEACGSYDFHDSGVGESDVAHDGQTALSHDSLDPVFIHCEDLYPKADDDWARV